MVHIFQPSSKINVPEGSKYFEIYGPMGDRQFQKGSIYFNLPVKYMFWGGPNIRAGGNHFGGVQIYHDRTINSLIPTIFPWSIPVKSRHPPAIRNPIPSKKRKLEESTTPSKVAKREIEIHEEQIAQLEEKY